MDHLVEKAERYVSDLFNEQLSGGFLYHNFTHTRRVIKSTEELCENSQIDVKQRKILLLAVWFHDTGYTKTYKGHEEESAQIAQDFLQKQQADPNLIKEVKRLILATRLNHQPQDMLEEIIKDADTSHFGKDYYEQTSELLRQELQQLGIKDYSPVDWREESIEVLADKHEFYTPYALEHWQEQKEKNLSELLKAGKKAALRLEREKTKAKLKAKYKNQSPDRGIQTLYRVTMRNHLKLSDIADTKANILLSVNAIIISLALANLIPYIDTPSHRHLMIPTLILVLFSVASIIGSIMSTRPNVTSGEFTREQVANKDVNVLFFGNFHQMPYQEFEWAMNEILKDQTYVYNSLSRDLYYLGVVLNRKYRLLRITYTIFMIGIILSVAAFIITFYFM